MTHNTLFKVVAGVLALSAGLAFTPVGAQTSTTEEIVSTTCGAGLLTKCGTVPTHESCGWSFGLTPIPGLPFPGISISYSGCTVTGSRDVFKDYRKGTASSPATGVCVGVPKFPTDPKKDESADYLPVEGEESC